MAFQIYWQLEFLIINEHTDTGTSGTIQAGIDQHKIAISHNDQSEASG